jgi:hypothetical protein
MQPRRIAAIAVIILGALLMLLAPQQTVTGIVLIGLGAVIEIIGFALERRS